MELVRPSPGPRHRAYVALVVGAVGVAIAYEAVLLATDSPASFEVLGIAGMVAFTSVGALILDRRPGQSIGRVCLAMGLLLGASTVLRFGAIVLDVQPGRLPPIGAAMGVLSGAISSTAIIIGGPTLISRFPDDTRPRWQRISLDLLVATIAVGTMSAAIQPGRLSSDLIEQVENPLGIAGIPLIATGEAMTIALSLYAAAYLIAGSQLALRYRRGGAIVRAQIRWFAAAIVTTFALLVAIFLTMEMPWLNELLWPAWIASLLLPPIAIAVAILRYRLYDIDRIVSRTVGYAAMSVVLFAVFAAVNLVLQNVLSGVTSGEALPVAFATLTVAALFNPVRARVQRIVDRRFHRARLDADRMAAEFASHLRDELDTRTLTDALAASTTRALEPSMAAVWLRGHDGRR